MKDLSTAEILLIAHAALRDGDVEEVLDLIYDAWRQVWRPHDSLPPFFSGVSD